LHTLLDNYSLLVDSIELPVQQGVSLDRAVIDAGTVRFDPIMLTTAAAVIGASAILFDPIFQGRPSPSWPENWPLSFFSRMTVPVLYCLDKRWETEHLDGASTKATG